MSDFRFCPIPNLCPTFQFSPFDLTFYSGYFQFVKYSILFQLKLSPDFSILSILFNFHFWRIFNFIKISILSNFQFIPVQLFQANFFNQFQLQFFNLTYYLAWLIFKYSILFYSGYLRSRIIARKPRSCWSARRLIYEKTSPPLTNWQKISKNHSPMKLAKNSPKNWELSNMSNVPHSHRFVFSLIFWCFKIIWFFFFKQTGLKIVFDEAILAALDPPQADEKSFDKVKAIFKKCSLL